MNDPKTALSRVAFVGDYLPRQCGIATFTHDLYHAFQTAYPEVNCQVIAVTDPDGAYDYAPEVSFEIRERHPGDYRRAAEFLQFRDAQCLCVQHEFGIYGGRAGRNLLTMLRDARLPIVTTCHTLLEEPKPAQKAVFLELAQISQRLVTMSQRGRDILQRVYGVPDGKIDVIPHGIRDMPFVDPSFFKDKFGAEGRKILLTFGLLTPGKGIEHAIRAMPKIARKHPEALYLVVGATHPHLVRREGEKYRAKLQDLVKRLGVEDHVRFVNRFVSSDELAEFIGACDIYLTPYLNAAQITSGTLSYAFGCGKAVVSTPYWHAEELLAGGRGKLVSFRNASSIANAVIELLDDETARARVRKEAYLAGRESIWPRVAERYMESFLAARQTAHRPEPAAAGEGLAALAIAFPEPRLDHLRRLTDGTGIFHQATFGFPDFSRGYALDDNARALALVCRWQEQAERVPEADPLASVYAAFVNHAFHAPSGRFRNYLGFDRRWIDGHDSEDAHGRALWALGVCVRGARQRSLQAWASNLFERALPAALAMDSPRAWAFALLGLDAFLRRLGGQRQAQATRRALARRLHERFRIASDRQWQWFEPALAFDNGELSRALIVSGKAMGDLAMLDAGLASLRWLMALQTGQEGCFAPVGGHAASPSGQAESDSLQQPVEAYASVVACLEAYAATGDDAWRNEAGRAFRWFLGANTVGESVYDAETGGCRDGLHLDRINQNEGAESTLSFQLALVEMRACERARGRRASLKGARLGAPPRRHPPRRAKPAALQPGLDSPLRLAAP